MCSWYAALHSARHPLSVIDQSLYSCLDVCLDCALHIVMELVGNYEAGPHAVMQVLVGNYESRVPHCDVR